MTYEKWYTRDKIYILTYHCDRGLHYYVVSYKMCYEVLLLGVVPVYWLATNLNTF